MRKGIYTSFNPREVLPPRRGGAQKKGEEPQMNADARRWKMEHRN
jgi:hypothetical protein